MSTLLRYEDVTELGLAKETGCLPRCQQAEYEIELKRMAEKAKNRCVRRGSCRRE